MMNLPGKGVFVTGTDTGVGKTFVSALLVKALRDRGIDAGYVKSAATGSDGSTCEDVEFVRRHTGLHEHPRDLCPVMLSMPASPYAAALAQGTEIDVSIIDRAVRAARTRHEFTVVEGVGGLLVPLTDTRTVLDLILLLKLPVLVVCRPGLGTVNHSLLTLKMLENVGVETVGFLTSGESDGDDPTPASNPRLIEKFSGAQFLGHVPLCPDPEGLFAGWTKHLHTALGLLTGRADK